MTGRTFRFARSANVTEGRVSKLRAAVPTHLADVHRLAESGDVSAAIALAQYWGSKAGRAAKMRAAQWWQQAAESGDAGAQYQLGWCYRDGVGVQRSAVKALVWIRRSAKQGHSDAEYSLAWMYSHGLGVRKNKRCAMQWYLRSAHHANVDAMFNVALFLENGTGTRRSIAEARRWYRRAARLGNKDAAHNLKRLGV